MAATRFLFLSYKRGAKTTPAVQRLFDRCDVQLDGFETFFDKRSIDAGDAWAPAIDSFLAKTTHFLALISIDFWKSEQCRRELAAALARYEASPPGTRLPRLLFVLADRLDPNRLSLDRGLERHEAEKQLQADADAAAPIARITKLGQINFLGPYDAAGKLVRLKLEDETALDDQLATLVEDLIALDGKHAAGGRLT